MSTTTIRLDDETKARISAAAAKAGKTPHAYMVEAIVREVEYAEIEEHFARRAAERRARYVATGEAVSLDDAAARWHRRVQAAATGPGKRGR